MEAQLVFRPAIFVLVFVGMALIELVFPHHHDHAKARRWGGNLVLFVLGILLSRLLLPIGAIGVAAYAEYRGWGLFNLVDWPGWLEILLAVVVFDFLIWVQHVVFHKVDWLWRLHRVHHADEVLDVTTGLRFHPIEIALSLAIKVVAIFILGPAAVAVFLFEVLLNAGSMITHANWKLPRGLDHALRFLVVTPGMHRVHHALDMGDTNSNYGFNLAIWDRLFRTYRPEPVAGDEAVRFGVEGYMHEGEKRVDRLLTQPFRSNGQN
jgi:sterol desaturase/sphingolipid hydroxylase (fatty acid hydroxylase superfamily)